MKKTLFTAGLWALASWISASTIVNPDDDVMTSAFFQGTDLVRGYGGPGSGRPVFRVSSDLAFGVGPETVYLDFSSATLSGVDAAILTMQSVAGGFGGDAGAGNPFIVSAHGVDANPFTAITDDTNPSGLIAWDVSCSSRIIFHRQMLLRSQALIHLER